MKKEPLESGPSKKGKGNSLKERIQKHLTDKNDVITEQDLKEIKVGVDETDTTDPGEPTFKPDDIPPSRNVNPWDILPDKK